MSDEHERTPVDPADHRSESETTADETQSTGGTPEAVNWDEPETWPREIGGQRGPEPTRYGDWERNGRCSDF
ncbi:DUF1674 domain-containing protein [Arhodomonas sp. AD133]|uniref:DUF1674 domain-containing protein n=1 Tax=Arhodomonas sp. AD133 TaxID=3415009 RepID=UPI003EBAAC3B